MFVSNMVIQMINPLLIDVVVFLVMRVRPLNGPVLRTLSNEATPSAILGLHEYTCDERSRNQGLRVFLHIVVDRLSSRSLAGGE